MTVSAPHQAHLQVRTYTEKDREAVWALHREGLQQTTPRYPEVLAHYEEDLQELEAHYLVPGAHFWVAEIGGVVVGMTGIERTDAVTGRLRRMRVTTSQRRRGIARALLGTAEHFCRQHGYSRLILDTTEQQVAAHHLYESAGFVRTGERMIGPIRVFDYVKELA